jgi:DUF2075 family protein
MIIYRNTKDRFVQDALDRDIEAVMAAAYFERTGSRVARGELGAWRESLVHMGRVMRDADIPDSAGVAIEYKVPQTSKRIDFIVTGLDDERTAKAIIVELKQWSRAQLSDKDGVIVAHRGGRAVDMEGPHPSYQAWSYATLLETFNAAVYEGGIGLRPCAYLHNYQSDGVIDNAFYNEYIERAPLFLKGEIERKRLQDFIKQHVRYGDKGELLYKIEHGRIAPSKMLADLVLGMLSGNPEFALIDDQKVIFESALKIAAAAEKGPKQVVIVQGGPGTGKSILAVNLVGTLLARGKNARYVSKNAAPRAVYATRLAGTYKKAEINNLFTGSGSFTETDADSFDALIVDEAHRLNERSGLYRNLGENQIKELIKSARCTIFFVDDDQRVTLQDIGHAGELRRWAWELRAQLTEMELTSQFRCNGSDGYLAWLENTLDIRPTANERLSPTEFDFRVVGSPEELHRLIAERNKDRNRSRVVAGYCWEWPSKKDPGAFDIQIGNYRRRWNLTKDGSLWIIAKESIDEVGCIHTCQGLELDYVGVIIGGDLTVRNGHVVTDASERARADKSISGLGRLSPDKAAEEASRIIKNTYRTLMTRGMRGCYVYCVDPELAAYLRSRLGEEVTAPGVRAQRIEKVVPLPSAAKGSPRAVPALDLKIAAGSFSDAQTLKDGALDWIELPDSFTMQPGLFMAQVIGESMNRRIPNGSWCLFRANPSGTRAGKVVLAQHRSIQDPELGGSYTVKVYKSRKATHPDGSWRHVEIELAPDSDRPEFKSIRILENDDEQFRIVAELIAVLA